MNSLIIRKARRDELKIIQELNYQLFLHDKKYDSQLNMSWPFGKTGKDYFKNKISGRGGVCFVAEVAGEVVGYLAGGMIKPYSYRNIKKQSELENTLVKENFRGRGIGGKLFEEFMKWSKEQGAERIKVGAFLNNLRAVKFYQKLGFFSYTAELEYEVK